MCRRGGTLSWRLRGGWLTGAWPGPLGGRGPPPGGTTGLFVADEADEFVVGSVRGATGRCAPEAAGDAGLVATGRWTPEAGGAAGRAATGGCWPEAMVGGIRVWDTGPVSATQRTAPRATSFSRVGSTMSAPRPVTDVMSATAARPSMRESTKPSTADSGRVRTSIPGTSSGTLSGNGFTG